MNGSPAAVPAAAIGVALAATTAYHLGLILEKRALRALPPVDARHPVGLLRTLVAAPGWLAGFAVMLCGFGLQLVALTLAQVSVVQPVLASGVVILVTASRIMLRERLGRAELGCVLAMAAAIALIALSAVGTADRVGRHANPVLLAVVAAGTCVVALGSGAGALRSAAPGRHAPPPAGVAYGVASGLLYGVATLLIKALAGTLAVHRAAHQALPAALLAVARSPYPYLAVLLCAAGLLIFQTGLQRCRVSIVGPVSNVTGSVFFLVAGTWLFGERLPADPVRLAFRLAGVVLAVVVVVVLSRQPEERDAGGHLAVGTA